MGIAMGYDTIDERDDGAVVGELMQALYQNHLMDDGFQIEIHGRSIELLLFLPDDCIGGMRTFDTIGDKAAHGIPEPDVILFKLIHHLHEDAVKAINVVSLIDEGGIGIAKVDTDGQ